MILKELDFLSPQITLYHKGFLSHSSVISGIISIISIIIIILLGVYYSLDLINRENPKIFFFNRFVEDSGIFPLNSSSIFHYISLGYKKTVADFDFFSFRLIGFQTYYADYFDNRNISNFDHCCIYGKCIYEKEEKKIKDLLNKEEFEKSACIIKYYNSLDKIYYDIDNPKFKWPSINHGNANPESTSYCVIMEKCAENTLELILGKDNKCKKEKDMEYLFNGAFGTHFSFIDHYIDVLDYKEPNRKYIFRVENTLDKDNYAINHINFNPSSIKTNDGVIFDKIKEELSYLYERNDAFEETGKNNNVYMIFNLWMKNRMQYYKRIYKTIQDVISDIGGISEIITMVACFINSFYNDYNTLSNFEKLISPSIKKTNNKNQINNTEIPNLNKNSIRNEENKSGDNLELEKNINTKDKLALKREVLKNESNNNNYNYIKGKSYKDDSIIVNDKDNNDAKTVIF